MGEKQAYRGLRSLADTLVLSVMLRGEGGNTAAPGSIMGETKSKEFVNFVANARVSVKIL